MMKLSLSIMRFCRNRSLPGKVEFKEEIFNINLYILYDIIKNKKRKQQKLKKAKNK